MWRSKPCNDPSVDCDQYKHINNPKSREIIFEIMNSFNLTDTFRLLGPSLKRYSWRRKPPLRQAKLDYFLVSHPMHDIITSCNINLSYRSDQSIVEINILPSKLKRGKGIWKFNCSLLKDDKYISLVTKIIQEEKIKYADLVYDLNYLRNISDDDVALTINDSQFLELVLLRIRGETIKYASYHEKRHRA